MLNFKLPVYPITIYSDNELLSSSFFGQWTDNKGNYYGSGARLYLKQGTYHLKTTSTNYVVTATVTLDVTVNAKTVSATAKVTNVESAVVGSITAEEPLTVTVDKNTKVWSFIPETDGRYYFWSEGSKDTYGTLCNSDGSKLRYSNDTGPGKNFYVDYDCKAGNTYYIAVYLYDGNPGEVTLHISATKPVFED